MAMSKYPTRTKEASSEFLGVLRGGGGISVDCQCGRTHIAVDSRELTDEERLKYLNMADDDSDTYHLERNVDCIMYKCLYNLMPYVIDCPCNSYQPYEQFIWTERGTIAKYLSMVKLRMQLELETLETWDDHF
jgi:hypothetical protein